jgi:DNA-directed RNA polymerase specialized sigma24 family protein
MSGINTGWDSQNGPGEDSALFDVRFWRAYRLLHFIACRILEDQEQAKKAVENCWHSASRRVLHFEYEGAFRSWLVRVLIDEALLLRTSADLSKQASPSMHLARADEPNKVARAGLKSEV